MPAWVPSDRLSSGILIDVYVNVNYGVLGTRALAAPAMRWFHVMPDTFSITDLAQEFDITPRTLRFYEDKGLLAPDRHGTARIYSRRDRARLNLILRGKRLGFSLAEIHEMLAFYEVGDGQVTQARAILQRSRDRIAQLKQQRKDIEDTVRELTDACRDIESFLDGEQGGGDGTKSARRRRTIAAE
jgi:DNA-binding transcriptional MerR regulator